MLNNNIYNNNTIVEWDKNFSTFQKQIETFNRSVTREEPKLGQISEIYENVKKSVQELENLTETIKGRKDELAEQTSCHRSRRVHTGITLCSGLTKIFGALGAIAAMYENESIPLRITATTLLALAGGCEASLYFRKRQHDFEAEELRRLNERSGEKLHQAQQFASFLEQLKILQTIGIQNLTNKTISSSFVSQPISPPTPPQFIKERVTKCLKEYDQMQQAYRTDEAYCAIVGAVIKSLPELDPLRKELEGAGAGQEKLPEPLNSNDFLSQDNTRDHKNNSQDEWEPTEGAGFGTPLLSPRTMNHSDLCRADLYRLIIKQESLKGK